MNLDTQRGKWFWLLPMCSLVPSVGSVFVSLVPSVGPAFVSVTTPPLPNSSPIVLSSYNDEVLDKARLKFLLSPRHIATLDNFLIA